MRLDDAHRQLAQGVELEGRARRRRSPPPPPGRPSGRRPRAGRAARPSSRQRDEPPHRHAGVEHQGVDLQAGERERALVEQQGRRPEEGDDQHQSRCPARSARPARRAGRARARRAPPAARPPPPRAPIVSPRKMAPSSDGEQRRERQHRQGHRDRRQLEGAEVAEVGGDVERHRGQAGRPVGRREPPVAGRTAPSRASSGSAPSVVAATSTQAERWLASARRARS